MGTTADKLNKVLETKAAIKDAIVAKGVTVADTDTFASYPAKIAEIQAGGGAPATKFGASVDTFLGDVDENGILNLTTWTGALNFVGVKTAGESCMQYAFYGCTGITSVDLSSLQSVDGYGMYHAFQNCTGITSIDLSSLQTIGTNGMYSVFQNCRSITSVDLSSLQSVDGYGMYHAFNGCTGITSVDLSSLQSVGNYGMQYAFYGCTGITSVDLSSLQTIGTNGMSNAFNGCTGITKILFPSLTDVQTNSFASSSSNGAFRSCTALTEIHFRADMQATIEAMSQYANKWGATNATIYFDL